MATYVAFLKGMNLGRRRVKNEELCEAFEAMKLGSVSAFLASGNVIFSTKATPPPRLERKLEKHLEATFDYEVPTFVRSAEQVASIAAQAPFDAATLKGTTGNLQVALLASAPSPASKKAALALATRDDALAIVGTELYWLPKGNMSDSELDLAALGKQLGLMTIRTQRTLIRLGAKLA